MKTFDEAADMLNGRHGKQALYDLGDRYGSILWEDAARNELVAKLCVSLVQRVASEQIDIFHSYLMAFQSGLVVGLEMNKSEMPTCAAPSKPSTEPTREAK